MTISPKFVFLALLLLLAAEGAWGAGEIRLKKVHDGDTLTLINKSGRSVKIRLLGIDAPELAQIYGEKSKRHLIKLLAGKKITYKSGGKDNYGRTLATVFADGENVNAKMVRDGFAWHYKNYSPSKKLALAQAEARKEKRGLWADDNPEPPWEFRRESKGEPYFRNDPFFKIPVSAYLCVHPKTFEIIFRREGCPRGYYAIIGK